MVVMLLFRHFYGYTAVASLTALLFYQSIIQGARLEAVPEAFEMVAML